MKLNLSLLLAVLAMPLIQVEGAGSRRQILFPAGTNTLAGLLELPARAAPHPVILFATDDGPLPKETFVSPRPDDEGQRNHHAIGRWDRFTRMGFACFAWDKAGTGESPGKWSPDTADRRAEEILAALATLRRTEGIDSDRIGIWCNAQAARALALVLAETNPAFIISVTPPTQTPLEAAAERLRAELGNRGIEPARVARAVQLLLRKWEMLRSGIPYAALTQHIAEERVILGDADHSWLAPFTPAEFEALKGPRQGELEGWFRAPFNPLRHLDIPVLAFFSNDDPEIANRPEIHPHLNILQLPDADHQMRRTAGDITPNYWSALKAFFTARFPEVERRAPTVFKTATINVADLTVEFSFRDEQTIAHELNLTDLTRRALTRYREIFGGPPRDEAGNSAAILSIRAGHGDLSAKAAPARVDLTIGPQEAFGYIDWRVTFLHELAHLWVGHSFKPASTMEEWFNEGATEYLAIKTAIRLGVIQPARAPDLLTACWANYLGARGVGEMSLRDASQAGRREHYFLVHHGGLTACMVMDYELRRRTENKSGIEDLLRRLHADTRYDANTLVQRMGEMTRHDFAPFFRRHIAGPQIIPVGQHITRMEVEAVKTGQLNRLPDVDRLILESIFELPQTPGSGSK